MPKEKVTARKTKGRGGERKKKGMVTVSFHPLHFILLNW